MKPYRLLILPLVFIIAVVALALLVSSTRDVVILERTRLMMGTVVTIKTSLETREDIPAAEEAVARAFKEIGRVEDVFSVFKADSEISRINSIAGEKPVKTTAEVVDLIERAVEFNKKTLGAFDITVKPLADLWRRAGIAQKLPSEKEIGKALAYTGSKDILINRADNTVAFKKRGMAIDAGGVAKGYATARAVKILKDSGIKNALVNAGGDMYCLGSRSPLKSWRVGIRHPRDEKGIFASVELKDMAADTSGDYEKYFILGGQRYSHIIDPRTGYPVGNNIVSATVIASDPADADMLATALCVLGKTGLGVVQKEGGVEAFMIYNDGDILKTFASEGVGKYGLKEE